jgi:hypothetical protein
MKVLWASAISAIFLAHTALPQSLGDLARQERERKAKEPKSNVMVTSDEVAKGKLDISPRVDPARKGDLDYLLGLLAHPRVSTELLAAFVPLSDQALPRLQSMLGSPEPLKRVGPGTVLMTFRHSEGLAAMAQVLSAAMEAVSAAATEATGSTTTSGSASRDEVLRHKIQLGREANYALNATKFGVWRFTEGNTLTPDQVVQRLEKEPTVEIVGGVDNGQRVFNSALRDKDPNLRLAAISLIRVATGGKDFGFQSDLPPEQNQAAIQEITTFLTTEREKVIAQLGTKARH